MQFRINAVLVAVILAFLAPSQLKIQGRPKRRP